MGPYRYRNRIRWLLGWPLRHTADRIRLELRWSLWTASHHPLGIAIGNLITKPPPTRQNFGKAFPSDLTGDGPSPVIIEQNQRPRRERTKAVRFLEALAVSPPAKRSRGRPKAAKQNRFAPSPEQEQKRCDNSGEENTFEVETILDTKKLKGSTFYLVRWKGWDENHDSWVPATNIDAPGLITTFKLNHKRSADKGGANDKALPPAAVGQGGPPPPPPPPLAPPPEHPQHNEHNGEHNDGIPPPGPPDPTDDTDFTSKNSAYPRVFTTPPTLPTSWNECADQLLTTMATLHLVSRPLARLPPTDMWDKELRATWMDSMRLLGDVMHRAIVKWNTNRDGLALLEATLAYVACPSHFIIPASRLTPYSGEVTVELPGDRAPILLTLPELGPSDLSIKRPRRPQHNDPPQTQSGGHPVAEIALRLIKKRRQKKATKVLTGNGCARRTTQSANIIDKMHLNHGVALRPHTINNSEQVYLTEGECAKAVVRKSKETQASIDVYGWSPDMTHDIAGDPKHPFITASASLMTLLSKGDVPLAVAFVLTAGGLSPFNKLSHEENEERIQNGLDPALRPVNNGVMITKNTTILVCGTPAAVAAKKKLSPIQLGLGTKAGPEIAAHNTQALWAQGCAISSEDGVNGFNAIKRQAVIDAVHERWPEGDTFVNTLYGHASPCFFSFSDGEGNRRIRVILSVEGTRMGCPLGSFGFDLAMAHFVYDKLFAEFKKQAIIRALTDDLIPAFKPPLEDSYAAWEEVYNNIALFWDRYDSYAGPIGIVRNLKKSALLLPNDAPEPLYRERAGRIVLVPRRDGLVVSGAPIGTDAFRDKHAEGVADRAIIRVGQIMTLALADPHVTWRLLGLCANRALDYYMRVAPPRVTLPHAKRFDTRMQEARDELLCPGGSSPKADTDTVRRSQSLSCLPFKRGGLGHIKATDRAPSAYLASFMNALRDRTFFAVRGSLANDVSNAYTELCERLGVEHIYEGHSAAAVLPSSPEALIDGRETLDLFTLIPKIKVHEIIMGQIGVRQRNLLREECVDGAVPQLRDSLRHRILALTSRSQLNRVLCSDLSSEDNRINSADFIAGCRWYLGLPQLTVWGAETVIVDGNELETCRRDKHELMVKDPEGDHLVGCPSSYGLRSALHTALERVFYKLAKLSGLYARTEPPTEVLLNNQITKEQARTMFPKSATKKVDEWARQLRVAIAKADIATDNTERNRLLGVCETIRSNIPSVTMGRRIDILVRDEITGDELWIDVTARHDTTVELSKDSLEHHLNICVSDGLRVRDLSRETAMSPAMAKAEKDKFDTYKPLTTFADLLVTRKKRRKKPAFVCAAVSHTGEFSWGTFKAIEWMATKEFDRIKREKATDGISPKEASGFLRMKLKDALSTAMWAGWGATLRFGGGANSKDGDPISHCNH
jgi:hypothetical protein